VSFRFYSDIPKHFSIAIRIFEKPVTVKQIIQPGIKKSKKEGIREGKKKGIILKFHRTLLCPLITTKIERIPPPLKKGGQGDLGGYPPEKSPMVPFFQRGKYHFQASFIWA
jgi:hypothetical protein